MLKNKSARIVSLILAVFMLATIIQMPLVSAAGAELSVTDTTKNAPFFDLEGDMKTNGTNHDYVGNWYALNSELSQDGETGYMIFSFDGSKSAVVNGIETKINGKPQKVEFALLTYNWVDNSGSLKYEMSADKIDWYSIKNNGGTSGYIKYEDADSALRAKYSDLNSLGCVTQSGANRNYYTITLPETFTDGSDNTVEPKYVRIGGTDIKGYCRVFAKPTITWESAFGSFSVQNSMMVYPTDDDLKLDFSDVDISGLTKEDITVAENDGTVAEISEISVNGNTVNVIFAEALKPYTNYTVTVAATAVELTTYTQKFKTTPAFEIKTFKDTTMEDKTWFSTSSNVTPKNGQYYELGYYHSPRLSAEGKMRLPGDGEKINGTICEVEFVLGYYVSTYELSSGKLEARDINNTIIAEYEFEDYVSEGAPEIAFAKDMAKSYIKIPDGVFPRDTVSVTLNIGQEGQTVAIAQPGIKWRDFGLNAEISTYNGKVIPGNSIELEYMADIDASTVTAAKYALNNGTDTVNPSSVTVNANKVVLTFADALAAESTYTLICNNGCYSARPYGVIKTTEGLCTYPDEITFATDVTYEEKSFTDTKASYGWLILDNVYVTSATDTTYCGWYGQPLAGNSSVIFAFDNSGAKMIGNSIYRPDGIIKEIKFALGHFGGTTSKSFAVSISADGVNYTDIGTVADFVKADDESLYSDVTFASFAQKKYVSIDSSVLNIDTKYVKIDMPQNCAALCKPSVKYLVPVVDYRVMPIYTNSLGAPLNVIEEDTITVTCSVEGNCVNDGYVLIMAAYENGILTDAKVSSSDDEKHQAKFTITDVQTDYIKTFLFSDIGTITPLVQSITFGPVE